jgi:hypothetical protein
MIDPASSEYPSRLQILPMVDGGCCWLGWKGEKSWQDIYPVAQNLLDLTIEDYKIV